MSTSTGRLQNRDAICTLSEQTVVVQKKCFEKATRCNLSFTSCLSPSGCKSSPTAAPLSSCLKLSHGAALLASLQSSVTPGSTVSLLCVCTSPSHPPDGSIVRLQAWGKWAINKDDPACLAFIVNRWLLDTKEWGLICRFVVCFCFFNSFICSALWTLVANRQSELSQVQSTGCCLWAVVLFFFLQTCGAVRNKRINDSWTRKCSILGVKSWGPL